MQSLSKSVLINIHRAALLSRARAVRRLLALLASLSTSAALSAELVWQDAWVRSMPPGTQVAAAYGTVTNQGVSAVTISGVTSSLNTSAMMHDSVVEGEQRKMVHLPSLVIESGEQLSFLPGGKHIMLMNVDPPLAEGDSIELCLVTASGDSFCAQAPVLRQAPLPAETHHEHHHH